MQTPFARLVRKAAWYCGTFLLLSALFFLLGPRPEPFTLDHRWPVMPETPTELEKAAASTDSGLRLREDNHSRIIWFNAERKNKTPVAMLYLHGFSASWYEGEPLHRELCSRMGMNLYLPRLASHGLETPEPLLDLRPETLYRSALNALALTEKLGERVIIAGTSTGAALAILLAAEFPEKISALLLFSPNIRLADPKAWVLTQPWGLQLARLFSGSRTRDSGEKDPVALKYWYSRYRLEGVRALQQLLEKTMVRETFIRVLCPLFLGYHPGDTVVSVPAMMTMFEGIETPDNLKMKRAFPAAGTHLISSGRFCRDYEAVLQAATLFLKKTDRKLGLWKSQSSPNIFIH